MTLLVSLFAAGIFLVLWLRAPRWLSGGLFALALGLSVALWALGGLERALAPLLLPALALGLLQPTPKEARRTPSRTASATTAVASSRPLRQGRARFRWLRFRFSRWLVRGLQRAVKRVRAPRDTSSPFDLWDVPGYDVLEKVGSGGMASVFRARRKRDNKTVALKIPAEGLLGDERLLRGFHREAEVARHLAHPNIVKTFEHGSVGTKHYIALEFVDGQSLESYISVPENLTDYAVSCELMRQAVSALRYVHEAGIVHRDIKPANLMVQRAGIRRTGVRRSGAPSHGRTEVAPDALKLMDFGVAGGELLAQATAVGARVGTPSYMSPEQARGLRTDQRSDIYSLGLVFYELLTGQTAFRGGYEAVVHQQIFALPPPPRQHAPGLPRALEQLVMQMIAKEPSARPSLSQIEARLLSAPLEAGAEALQSRLLCLVKATQGALRVLDTAGNLHTALGKVGVYPGALPATPQACTSDALGNLYLAVSGGETQAEQPMIYKLSPRGEILLAFGSYGLGPGTFLRPVALAAAPDGTLLVLDAETHLVQRFDTHGVLLSSFGGQGGGEGRFNDPRDLLVGARGDLFVLDYGNRQVQRLSPEGDYKNCWAVLASPEGDVVVSGRGVAEGRAGGAEFHLLTGFTLNHLGELYLAEGESEVYKVFLGRPGGDSSRLGRCAARLEPVAPTLDAERGVGGDTERLLDLAVDELGNLFCARRGGQTICKYAPGGTLLATTETYAPIVQLRLDVKG